MALFTVFCGSYFSKVDHKTKYANVSELRFLAVSCGVSSIGLSPFVSLPLFPSAASASLFPCRMADGMMVPDTPTPWFSRVACDIAVCG